MPSIPQCLALLVAAGLLTLGVYAVLAFISGTLVLTAWGVG